jgi:hypothetical protein
MSTGAKLLPSAQPSWTCGFPNPCVACLYGTNDGLYSSSCESLSCGSSSPLSEGITCTDGVSYPSTPASDVGPLLPCGGGGGGGRALSRSGIARAAKASESPP